MPDMKWMNESEPMIQLINLCFVPSKIETTKISRWIFNLKSYHTTSYLSLVMHINIKLSGESMWINSSMKTSNNGSNNKETDCQNVLFF